MTTFLEGSVLGGCSTYPDFGDWSYLWRDLGLSKIFGCWTDSRQSDWTVLGKISWIDKYHSPSEASCLTDPSQQDVWGDGTIFPTTRITHCYPFSTAAALEHFRIMLMVEQRFYCLKYQKSSVSMKVPCIKRDNLRIYNIWGYFKVNNSLNCIVSHPNEALWKTKH